MDYLKIYNKLIDNRKELKRDKKTKLYETHHILPVSLGGSNEKNNLVLLTPKEHFIAHLLLYKIHSGKNKAKMAYALLRMCSNNKNQNRRFTSRQYEFAKNAIRKTCIKENHHSYKKELWSDEEKTIISQRQTGENNSMYGKNPWNKGKKGKSHSEETKLKMSESHKGKEFSEETRKKLSAAHIGKKLSDQTKEKLRQANLGKKLSKESIEKTASFNRGKKQNQITCPHCNATGGNTMHRWHFDNCRKKI